MNDTNVQMNPQQVEPPVPLQAATAGPYAQQSTAGYAYQQTTHAYQQAQAGANFTYSQATGMGPFPSSMQSLPTYAPDAVNRGWSAGQVPVDMPYYAASPIEAIKRLFRKYAVFSGRASRSEFWWSALFLFIVTIILQEADTLFFGAYQHLSVFLWMLVTIVPFIALAIRRLHDTNKSGWWIMLPLGFITIGPALFAIGMLSTGLYHSPSESPTIFFIVLSVIAWYITLPVSVIAFIVLAVMDSNPAGARFDAHMPMPPMRPASPMATYAGAGQFGYGTGPSPHPQGQRYPASGQVTGYGTPPVAGGVYDRPMPAQQQPYAPQEGAAYGYGTTPYAQPAPARPQAQSGDDGYGNGQEAGRP